MCACRRAKSFLIEDILADAGGPPRPASEGPAVPTKAGGTGCSSLRRHTYPVCPMPLRYPPAPAPPPAIAQPCCSPLLMPLAMRHAYSLDAGTWWRASAPPLVNASVVAGASMARRAGGQVRFTAAQASALERRFSSARYLSPDQRRRLARDLRLSDRQVKTWFQNRRAKWRRTAPAPSSDTSTGRGTDRDIAPAERDSEHTMQRNTRDTVLAGHKDMVLAGHRDASSLQGTRSRVCALASC